MDALKQQIEGLPTDEWEALLAWVVGPERQRREALPLVEQATTEVITGLQDAGELTAPEAGTVGEAPPYAVGVEYLPGSRFTWQGRTWEVLQAHTSASHWPPDQAPSLYKAVN